MPREPLDPNKIFRECDARDIFGFAPTQLKQRIKEGAIPRPVLLAPPPSRAKGWYEYMINEHRARVEAQQEAWAAEKKNFYVPTPPQQRKKPEPMKPKVKKVKLILPRKAKG
jgi:hypothetical protein